MSHSLNLLCAVSFNSIPVPLCLAYLVSECNKTTPEIHFCCWSGCILELLAKMSDYHLWKEGFWQPPLRNAAVLWCLHDVKAKRNNKTKVIKFCCNLPHRRWRERAALSGAAGRCWRSFRGHLTSAQYLKGTCDNITNAAWWQCDVIFLWDILFSN